MAGYTSSSTVTSKSKQQVPNWIWLLIVFKILAGWIHVQGQGASCTLLLPAGQGA